MKTINPIPVPVRVYRNWQLIAFAKNELAMTREAFKELLREYTGVTETGCLTPDGQEAVKDALMQIARERATKELRDDPPAFIN